LAMNDSISPRWLLTNLSAPRTTMVRLLPMSNSEAVAKSSRRSFQRVEIPSNCVMSPSRVNACIDQHRSVASAPKRAMTSGTSSEVSFCFATLGISSKAWISVMENTIPDIRLANRGSRGFRFENHDRRWVEIRGACSDRTRYPATGRVRPAQPPVATGNFRSTPTANFVALVAIESKVLRRLEFPIRERRLDSPCGDNRRCTLRSR